MHTRDIPCLYVVTVMINMYTRDIVCMYAIVLVINACLSQSFNAGVILSPLSIITGDGSTIKHDHSDYMIAYYTR